MNRSRTYVLGALALVNALGAALGVRLLRAEDHVTPQYPALNLVRHTEAAPAARLAGFDSDSARLFHGGGFLRRAVFIRARTPGAAGCVRGRREPVCRAIGRGQGQRRGHGARRV